MTSTLDPTSSAEPSARPEPETTEAHHELLLRSLESIVITVDAEGRVLRWNRAAEDILGMLEAETRGRPISSLDLDWNVARLQSALRTALEGETARLDDFAFRPHGKAPRVLGIKALPMRIDEAVVGVLLTGADITERRGMQAQIQQAERLESIGRLAAGIAHEINTPIQFVGDNLRFLDDGLKDVVEYLDAALKALDKRGGDPSGALAESAEELEIDYLREELPRAVQQSMDGVGRVARIVRAMKELSHPPSKEKAPADINRAIESTTIVSKNEWKYCAQLDLDLESSLPTPTCLVNELSQVFLNVLVNAAHAVQERHGNDSQDGRLSIRTRSTADEVQVRFEDNGIGMTDEVRARCFDPFFTTKSVGRGTGQGLALTHAIVVEQHGGRIAVDTEPGRGTVLTLHIPLQPPEEA